MSHILALLLWTLSSTGATDACNAVAVAADAEATVCTPPPPPAEPNKKKATLRYDRDSQRRISNGF